MRISRNGATITSLQTWFAYAPPKGKQKQWVDGRSAKELAKAFLETGMPAEPPEPRALLSSSVELGEIRLREGWPEHSIPLDAYRGETRNADLAALGTGGSGPVAVTIEAKADESFGETIGAVLAKAPDRSNLPHRMAELTAGVVGQPVAAVLPLRYQLLHGAAATLIFAHEQRAAAAVFVVFEFRSAGCSAPKLKQNAANLDAFIQLLWPDAPPLRAGELIGPFRVPGGGRVPSHIPLYIGKSER